uniref:Uncharacterized protein n=1 Tax=Anguilla anguilla TaxID=7936 RepID=A0A0E9QIK8_ANGAN
MHCAGKTLLSLREVQLEQSQPVLITRLMLKGQNVNGIRN